MTITGSGRTEKYSTQDGMDQTLMTVSEVNPNDVQKRPTRSCPRRALGSKRRQVSGTHDVAVSGGIERRRSVPTASAVEAAAEQQHDDEDDEKGIGIHGGLLA